RLLILYGSQTGCAADVAERIRRAAKRRHYQPALFALDDYDRTQLIEERLVLFIVSTTGQGEEPDNMKKFWRFLLRKDLPRHALAQMEYSVFGLGDSSYEKFNYPAKKLYKRLQQLGGQPFHARGDGDDQHYLGMDGALDPWLDAVWRILGERFPLPEGCSDIDDGVLYPLYFPISFVEGDAAISTMAGSPHAGDHLARLTRNERVTPTSHFQDVRLVELKFDQLPVYEPGDIIDIMPENRPTDVEAFLDYIGLLDEADRPIRINYPLPGGLVGATLTLRSLCRYWLDVFSVARRSFFEITAHFAQDPEQAEKLHYFSSAAGQDDLYAYCYRMRRTAFEILQDFNSVRVPLAYLLEMFPFLRPRSFSIASSAQVCMHTDSIQLLIGIVKYRTRMATPRTGVFTRWLADMPTDISDASTLPIWIRRGTLRLPPAGPIILIAPGLGLAPMRALLEERLARQQHDNILIFGCRHQRADFYFNEQWRAMCEQGTLQLFTAFSRDQEEKRYVQHAIIDEAALLWTAIHERQGSIYLCGKAKRMPEDVADAFCRVFMEHGRLSQEEAHALMVTLKRTGRYQQECWD
ncbi:hypothetical protein SYNPS1DRAFT_14904, partial [Syncephalis pseudoplumigaleata]